MFDISNIFLPLVFSGSSRSAARFARKMASDHGARIEAVHVSPPLPRPMRAILFPYAGMGEDEVHLQHELCLHTRQNLEEFLNISLEKDTSFSLKVLPAGDNESLGAAMALSLTSTDCDLVMMGARGENGGIPGVPDALVMRVVGSAVCPVFLSQKARKVRVKHVLVALDFSPSSQDVLQKGIEMAIEHGASLTIMVVVPALNRDEVRGVAHSALRIDTRSFKGKTKKKVETLLGPLMDDVQIPFSKKEAREALKINTVVAWGDPVAEILKEEAKHDDVLLVAGIKGLRQAALTRKVGRVTSSLIANTHAHMLLVP